MNDTYVDLPEKTLFLRTVESTYEWSSQDRIFLKPFWKSENKFNASMYVVNLLLSKDEYNFDIQLSILIPL